MQKNLVYALLVFAIFCLVLEAALRLYFGAAAIWVPQPLKLEKQLGWAPPAFSKSVSKPKGFDQVAVVSTVRDGFRAFGDPAASRKKMFVIGDSFTQAVTVSDGQTYYDLIARTEGLELFAFGCGGYGTLQEYMVLDRYVDEIHPDLILWQFSMNDLVNNDHEIESRSRVNNNRNVRPYWIGGRIERHDPEGIGWLPAAWTRASVLARFIAVKLNLIFPARETIEAKLKPGHPLLQRSEETTIELMRMVKRRAGPIPVVAFLADDGWNMGDANFERICKAAGITFVPGVPEIIREAKKRGFKADGSPYDSHWSHVGNQIVGQYLLDKLFKQRALPAESGGVNGRLE